MVSGMVDIEPIWRALGRRKGPSFAYIPCIYWSWEVLWNRQNEVYMKADVHLSRALMKLPMEGDLSQEVKDELAKFVCSRYCPKDVRISSIPDLRWYLFCKQLAESNKLPPTLGALEEHINRVCLQSRVGCQATVMQQQPLDPHYNSVTTWTQMVSCCHSLPRFFLHPRPSSSWSDASAEQTAQHRDVPAEVTLHRTLRVCYRLCK